MDDDNGGRRNISEEEKAAIEGLKRAKKVNDQVEAKLAAIGKIARRTDEERAARIAKRRKEREKKRRKKQQKKGMFGGFFSSSSSNVNDITDSDEPAGIQDVDEVVWYDCTKSAEDQILNATGAPIPQNLDPSPLDPDLDEMDQALTEAANQEPDSSPSIPKKETNVYVPAPIPANLSKEPLGLNDSAPIPATISKEPLIPQKQTPVPVSSTQELIFQKKHAHKPMTYDLDDISPASKKEPGHQYNPKPAMDDPDQNPFASNIEAENPFDSNRYEAVSAVDSGAVNPFEAVQAKMRANNMASPNSNQNPNKASEVNSTSKPIEKRVHKPLKLPEIDSSKYSSYSVPKIVRNERGIPIIVKPESAQTSKSTSPPSKLDFHV